MIVKKYGTPNIIAKLEAHRPAVLFIDKTGVIPPYKVDGLDSMEYHIADEEYKMVFSGNEFTIKCSEYDIYILTS